MSTSSTHVKISKTSKAFAEYKLKEKESPFAGHPLSIRVEGKSSFNTRVKF